MKRVEVIQKMEVRPRLPLLPADHGFNQPLPLKPKEGQSMFAFLPDEVVSSRSTSSLQNIPNPQAVQDFPTLTLKLEAGTLQLQPSQDQPGKVQAGQNQDGQAQLGQDLPKLSFKLEAASAEDHSPLTVRMSQLVMYGIRDGFDRIDIATDELPSVYKNTYKLFHRPFVIN